MLVKMLGPTSGRKCTAETKTASMVRNHNVELLSCVGRQADHFAGENVPWVEDETNWNEAGTPTETGKSRYCKRRQQRAERKAKGLYTGVLVQPN